MRLICFFIITVLTAWNRMAFGQENTRDGSISGSFETNTIYYMKDSKINAEAPFDRFGSNNYLKFDYRIGKFSAGLMYEAYLPVLQGYPGELKESDIVFKYASFEDRGLSVLAGDFYDQFGSGLVFRAYEDRTLGLNTSVEGIRLEYRYGNMLTFKGIYGRPRRYMKRAECELRGADITADIAAALGWENSILTLGGSYVSRYERYTGTEETIDPSVDAYSLRLGWGNGGWSFQGELVKKTSDAAEYNAWKNQHGSAVLLELGYTGTNVGVLLTGRRLEYMDFRSSRESQGIGEGINYIPALTRQYTYSLANLNPYAAQMNGEIGGQVDLYYLFPKGSVLGGKRGMKVALNFSTYYDLKPKSDGKGYEAVDFGDELLFRDLSADVTKEWNKRFKTIFMYSFQTYNPLITGHESDGWDTHVIVGDFTYKLNPRNSFRLELQYLWMKADKKEWVAGMLEYNLAPAWSFFVSDMYNYGDTDLHYYTGGISFAKSRSRIALNFGRNRAGYNCSGGICRATPAYTGFNLSLTTSF